MLNIVVLDVVIGLVFIYLLYSLLVTIIQEIIATQFGFRAKILQRSVFRMLEDESKFTSRFKSILYLFKKSGNGGEINSTTYEFYNHPLIKFLGEGKHNDKPAYINKETFSKVIIDMLRGEEVKPGDDVQTLIQKALDEKKTLWGKVQISDQTLSYFKSIWADAEGDVTKFKRHLENWFDETMDRASGWYKKHIQFILFIIGFILSVAFNVDTIKIVDKLEKDPVLREQMIQHAEAFVKANPDLDKQIQNQKAQFDSVQALIERKNLPQAAMDSLQQQRAEDSLNILKSLALKAQSDTLLKRADLLLTHDINDVHHSLGLEWETYDCNSSSLFICILKSLAGWLITALALSLGAPFWFDLLNKLMKLRGSVATPTSDDRNKKQG